jgi:MFS family permease
VVLPGYLVLLGFSGAQIGAVVTATLLGSAAVTLTVGLRGHRHSRLTVLHAAAALMIVTGIAFGLVTVFWGLLLIAFIGTINPTSGDVSVFLPTEQALLTNTVDDRGRTAVFARFTLVAAACAALGALAAGLPDALVARRGLDELTAHRAVFWVYAALGVIVALTYRRLSPGVDVVHEGGRAPLGPSRRHVIRLAGLFSLDAFAGGFVVQSILVLWLSLRFDLSTGTAGVVFFWSGLLSAVSALASSRIAARIGLVRTMVYTHIPASVLLIATALTPSPALAIALLLCRSLLSQMDVPARTSYVMATVTPPERAAAATLTNVPRSLASALPPLAAGWMLDRSTVGWPLMIAGTLKITYDLLLLRGFRNVRPPEER